MAAVTPQKVKELREMTLAGMSDCKKALDAAEGDIDKAVVILREKGLANAAKKANRVASEGTVSAFVSDNKYGYVFEVNCETDFVTKNESFQALVSDLAELVKHSQCSTLEGALALKMTNGGTVQDALTHLTATIGEKITLRRFGKMGNGTSFISSYIHAGGKIGVLVELTGTGIPHGSEELAAAAKDVALQIAAMKPQYVNASEISDAVIKQEEEIIRNKFLAQGKPEAALAKIVPSSLKTWFKEVCLNDQLFVKEDSQTVAAFVANTGKKLGINDLKVVAFERMELGQGVEKKSDDFAAEVAATVAAAQQH